MLIYDTMHQALTQNITKYQICCFKLAKRDNTGAGAADVEVCNYFHHITCNFRSWHFKRHGFYYFKSNSRSKVMILFASEMIKQGQLNSCLETSWTSTAALTNV
jgi:hypothetical protein